MSQVGPADLEEMQVTGQRVVLRLDLNVPMGNGEVASTARIFSALETLEHIRRNRGRTIILAHLGRPRGQPESHLSLRPVFDVLNRQLMSSVEFCDDLDLEVVRAKTMRLEDGDVMLLENIRFHPGELTNQREFAQDLAGLGDLYCNDAFSASHRAHASVCAITEFLPACAGLLMKRELHCLRSILNDPLRPLAAIVGGAKISTKLAVLSRLIEQVDHLIIGGAMANTFLLAKGCAVGRSLIEPDLVELCKRILVDARDAGCRIALPVDIVTAPSMTPNAPVKCLPCQACPPDEMILDCGTRSIDRYKQIIAQCKSLVWNGPLGAFETPPFQRGTEDLIREVGRHCRRGHIIAVAGGGDTVAAIEAARSQSDFTYVSRAGGAFLEWLEGRELPGIASLTKRR